MNLDDFRYWLLGSVFLSGVALIAWLAWEAFVR